MGRTISYKEHLIERLRADPERAVAYLKAALEDDDPHVFLLALRDVTEAKGGIGWLAKETDLNRVSLYRTLSFDGNPRFVNFLAILRALDLNLSVNSNIPVRKPKKRKSAAKAKQSTKSRGRKKRSSRPRA